MSADADIALASLVKRSGAQTEHECGLAIPDVIAGYWFRLAGQIVHRCLGEMPPGAFVPDRRPA
jgi:hypothetical protein